MASEIKITVIRYQFRKKALELMDQGKKVVIGYERLAYGAGEGYVTLMAKE